MLRGAVYLLMSALLGLPGLTRAGEDDGLERRAFRVCADPNNLPFSSEKGAGFENKIAELFARKLGLPLKYYFLPQRLNFVRNTLRYKLPDEDYRCDIMMGVPAGYDQVLSTKPYFRSTHVLAYVKGGALDGVHSQEDFLKLGRERLNKITIGVYDRSPASNWLANHDLFERGRPFRLLNAQPDWYPGLLIENELAQGKIDAAVIWGPVAAYAATQVKDREIILVPLFSEKGVKFDFDIAMGVRRGEPKWKATIESLIDSNAAEIEAILRDYKIPLLDAQGQIKP